MITSGFKSLVNVNDNKMNKALGMVCGFSFILHHLFPHCVVKVVKSVYSRNQQIFLNEDLFGEVTLEGRVHDVLL